MSSSMRKDIIGSIGLEGKVHKREQPVRSIMRQKGQNGTQNRGLVHSSGFSGMPICDISWAITPYLFETNRNPSMAMSFFDYCLISITRLCRGIWISFFDTEEAHAVMLAYAADRGGRAALQVIPYSLNL